jgi:hypothetical protein
MLVVNWLPARKVHLIISVNDNSCCDSMNPSELLWYLKYIWWPIYSGLPRRLLISLDVYSYLILNQLELSVVILMCKGKWSLTNDHDLWRCKIRSLLEKAYNVSGLNRLMESQPYLLDLQWQYIYKQTITKILCTLRFPRKYDVGFVFTSMCFVGSSCFINVICIYLLVSNTIPSPLILTELTGHIKITIYDVVKSDPYLRRHTMCLG